MKYDSREIRKILKQEGDKYAVLVYLDKEGELQQQLMCIGDLLTVTREGHFRHWCKDEQDRV